MAAYFQDAGEDEPLSAAAESGNGSVYLLLRREETDWHLPLLWKLYGSRFLPSFRKAAGICRRFGFWKSGFSGEVRLVSTGGVLAGCDYRKILGGSL